MNILNDPHYKNKYQKSKYIVKSWEKDFKAKHGRVPSKHDIREADLITKNAYRDYFYLKTKALEETLNDVDLSFDSRLDSSDVSDISTSNSENVNNIAEISCSKLQDLDSSCNNEKQKEDTSQKDIDDVWGQHLNKQKAPKESKLSNKLNSSISLSQKLFAGSKFKKKVPRKSVSFVHRKSSTDLSFLVSASQPSTISNENDSDFSSIFGDNFKVVQTKTPTITQPVSIIQKAIKSFSDLTPMRTIDKGWLERTTVDCFESLKKGISVENDSGIDSFGSSPPIEDANKHNKMYGLSNVSFINYTPQVRSEETYDSKNYSDCEDIVCNSESEEEKSLSQHIIKKRKILIEKSISSNDIINKKNSDKINKSADLNTIDTIVHSSNISNEPIKECKQNLKPKTKKKLKENFSDIKKSKIQRCTLNRKVKNVKSNTFIDDKTDQELEDPFKSDNDYDNDPDFNETENSNKKMSPIENEKKKKVTKKITRTPRTKKRKSNTVELTEHVDETIDSYIELSRTPLPETVPRFKLSTKVIKNIATISKTKLKSTSSMKKAIAKNKLEQKVDSGNLNENFVRINLKKKVFVRGKKTMTFSKYKNKQWLAKKKAGALAGPDMDMRGCDGGMLTCFKCGEVGHFARNCKADQGENLLPLEADTGDISPYPTLEEAASMASQSNLARHVTSKNMTSQDENKDNLCTSVTPAISDEDDESTLNGELDDAELINMIEIFESQSAPRYPVPEGIVQSNEVKPLYKLNEDGSLIDTPQEVYEALKHFGHTSFRPGQERAIMRILSGLSTLVTLSTGSGKSLCYQLPAFLYAKKCRPCIALVISPLVSLMEDQVSRSERIGCLHTGMTKTSRDKVMDKLKAGEFDAILVSPEAIVSSVDYLLRYLPPISFACVDEVHCVSQWSHNFRPSYLTVCRVLREKLNTQVMLGLTATAPLATRRNIVEHLKIPDGDAGLVGSTPLPDNLTLTISKDEYKDVALISMLKSDTFCKCNSIVIYCTRRDECERLSGLLRTYFKEEELENRNKKRKRLSWVAESYHAGLSASRRRSVQNAFMSGELKIVVATVAFGMGINKSDIRVVIHYNMPRNFESYVQEVGRAGRDGLPAYCHLFLDSNGNDQNELRRHIYSDSIDRYAIRKLLQRVFIPCDCGKRGISCPKHEVAFSIEETVRALDIPEENIATLLCYLELHEKRFIQVLTPAYIQCKVTSYGGPLVLRKAAQNCAPLAMAIALEKQRGHPTDKMNAIEFPVIDVAAAIGWDSGMVKHHLKNLEWTTENGCPKRSNLTVTLSSLGFRIRAPGDLTSEDLDEALDSLHNRVVQQEHSGLVQLQQIYKVFVEISTKTYNVDETIAKSNSDKLKEIVLEHFESERPSDNKIEIQKQDVINKAQIINDVRTMISMYRDNTFTGRSLARIFHGIPSPNYPAVVWGRCKFWRAHLNVDFNAICKIATIELLRMR